MNWKDRQHNDKFVKKRKENNLISRAYFKIEEIDEKFKIFSKSSVVVELGASPGGWTQYVSPKVSHIYAYDFLPIKIDAPNLTFFQTPIEKIKEMPKCNILLSDMAPNFIGNSCVDKYAMENLLDCIFQWSNSFKKVLFVIKVFQFNIEYILEKKLLFSFYKFFKPKPSRAESQELYLIGRFSSDANFLV